MRESTTFTVSLPPAMAKEIERAMKAEHRTRSELVREALRVYLSARLIPAELPTPAEARAYRRGMAAYKRGAELLQYCQTTLKDAQQQVLVLEKGVLKSFAAADADTAGGNES